ncbi:MAG: hypothetical protein ACI88G_000373 [Woeseiaceae bacterium]|jgi:hypothetical protein
MCRMEIEDSLHKRGYAHLGPVLTTDEAESLQKSYEQERLFRSHVIMQRHGFGEGEYKYFANPLPQKIAALRESLYSKLAPIANCWHERMRSSTRFPDTHQAMLARCHADGQTRPTPLLLSYNRGGFNCLHQDLYGKHVFPIQVVVLLSDPSEFQGGEFVLTEQRPRMQSRVEVVSLTQGHGVAFAVNERPKISKRGYYRVKMRHGVSEIRAGKRQTLGIIFHDAV